MSVASVLSRPRLRKTAIGVVMALVLFGLLGFFAVPPLVRSLAEKQGSEFLGRTLTLKEVSLNPYTLELSVSGLRLLEANGKDEAFTLAGLKVDVEWASLFKGAPVVRSLQIDQPWIRVVRQDAGQYNFSDVLKKLLDQPPSDKPALFSINNIVLRDGRIDIDDQPFSRKHVISGIQVGLPFVSNLPSDVELFVEPSIAAHVNDAHFALNGRVRPFSEQREAMLKIDFNALDLARFDEYSPVPLDFRISSGQLDTDMELGFSQPAGGQPRIALHGSVKLRDLALDRSDGKSLIRLPGLDVAINDLQPLAGKVDIASIRLDRPDFTVARSKDGKLNLLALLPKASAPAADATPAPAAPADAPKPDVKITLFEVSKARVAFSDEVPARPFSYVIEPVDIALRDFSLQGNQPATLVIGASGEGGTQVTLDAKVTAATPGIEGDFKLSGLDVPRLAPYFADRLNFSVDRAQARLAAHLKLTLIDGAPQGEVVVTEAGVARLQLMRKGDKTAFAEADDIVLSGASADLGAHRVSVESFDLIKPKLRAARQPDGSIDLASLVPQAPAGPAGLAAPAGAAPPSKDVAWSALLKAFRLKEGSLRLEDRTLAKPGVVALERLALSVENVGTDKALKSLVQLGIRDPKGGQFDARGGFSLAPVQAALKVDVRRLDLLVAQPWIAEQVNAELLHGTVSTRGDLGVQVLPAGDWTLAWNGETNVEDVHLTERSDASDLLKWRSLFAGGVAVKLDSRKPDLLASLSVGEVALTDYFARIIVSPQGRLNLQDIVRKQDTAASAAAPAAAAPAPAPVTAPARAAGTTARTTAVKAATKEAELAQLISSARPPIDVKTIVLQGGQVDFSDFFIKPNYRAQLSKLGGRVSGLSSTSGTAGEVELRGVVEGSAPIDITGRVNPLASALFLDIKASARGIELAPLSPYSGKYVGYGIEKGKLSVKIAYKIENDQLTAQNNVVLDQLTFGAPVNSPDAIKAPVLLAVSLLKDRNGVIDINLPISGSLSDPQFSIGGIVVKVIVNLIVKAVTSPFALLGSLFGSEADLDHVAFEPGLATLSDTARGKLDTLGKALTDRPALKLEVTGRTDRAVDVEGYRRALLDHKVRSVKAAQTKSSVEEVVVAPEEYPKLLEAVYKAESFPKPRNMIGLTKSLPVEEMEKLIFTNTEVTDENLRQLGLARAQAVKDYLAANAKIEDARLFVLAPKENGGAGAADKDGGKDVKDAKDAPARADFSIK